MTFQLDISNTLIQAKYVSGQWALEYIDKENNGDSLGCCELKLMLLVDWIEILEDYYNSVYVDFTTPCLTFKQAKLLLAKIKVLGKLTCNFTIETQRVTPVEPIVDPEFLSFTMQGQSTQVEVGDSILETHTFLWSMNLGTGIVPTIDIYDNSTTSTIEAGVANDGSHALIVPTKVFTFQGDTQSYKGIGNNTNPTSTFNSPNFVVTASYKQFYGPTAADSVTSAAVRALPFSRYVTAGNTFSFSTGTTLKEFEIWLPTGKTLSQVFDATAGFDITGSFSATAMSVNDFGGTSVTGNIYRLKNAVVYAASHTFNVTLI